MLSINTNLSSLLAQSSMQSSTQLLSQAVERMSTGYKINHAKDNAANYSIATNMTTKIGALQVAEDNAMQGLDMLNSASSTLEEMSDMATRLRALATQARNGTYSARSLAAINAEAGAIITEIQRLNDTAEYNGIKLLNNYTITIPDGVGTDGNVGVQTAATYSLRATPSGAPKPTYGKFIDNPIDYTAEEVAAMDKMSELTGSETISEGQYSISTPEDLAKLATMTDKGLITGGEFVLANDIDLKEYLETHTWNGIGKRYNQIFTATFNGNGHVVSNLVWSNTGSNVGFFEYIADGAVVKNLGLENASVSAGMGTVGILTGSAGVAEVSNCWTTGSVESLRGSAGGLLGNTSGEIINSYSTANVKGADTYSSIGGLIGYGGTLTNCFATGNVEGGFYVGGLAGQGNNVTNCYATGNVVATSINGDVTGAGGLIGYSSSANIESCYATGNVKGQSEIGGLIGRMQSYSTITNCYATGNATGDTKVAGLIGCVGNTNTISNCYATGSVIATGDYAGGLISTIGSSPVSNCYATGNVSGNDYVGGLMGKSTYTLTNCYASGNVTGNNYVGGLSGQTTSKITTSEATGNVEGNENVGGFTGSTAAVLEGCYSKGTVVGVLNVGGLVGQAVDTTRTGDLAIKNCVSYSDVTGNNGVGALIGAFTCTVDGTEYGNLVFTGVSAASQNMNIIGGAYKTDGTLLSSYDLGTLENKVTTFVIPTTVISLQIGTNSDKNSQITFDTVAYGLIDSLRGLQMESENSLTTIDNVISALSAKQVEFGSAINRVESALDEISTQYENLVSSRSTIRDADISEVSATYIQQQILQQAAATLMSTANQAPAIALQLI